MVEIVKMGWYTYKSYEFASIGGANRGYLKDNSYDSIYYNQSYYYSCYSDAGR